MGFYNVIEINSFMHKVLYTICNEWNQKIFKIKRLPSQNNKYSLEYIFFTE